MTLYGIPAFTALRTRSLWVVALQQEAVSQTQTSGPTKVLSQTTGLTQTGHPRPGRPHRSHERPSRSGPPAVPPGLCRPRSAPAHKTPPEDKHMRIPLVRSPHKRLGLSFQVCLVHLRLQRPPTLPRGCTRTFLVQGRMFYSLSLISAMNTEKTNTGTCGSVVPRLFLQDSRGPVELQDSPCGTCSPRTCLRSVSCTPGELEGSVGGPGPSSSTRRSTSRVPHGFTLSTCDSVWRS